MKFGHGHFLGSQFVQQPLPGFAGVVDRKVLREAAILHHQIPAPVVECVRDDSDLLHAVEVVIHRRHHRQSSAHTLEYIEYRQLGEVVHEHIR